MHESNHPRATYRAKCRKNVRITKAKPVLEQHTAIQLPFSRGCRVLHLGGLNHINLGVHLVHPQLAFERLKPSITKNHSGVLL
jgi:hypothetical protein